MKTRTRPWLLGLLAGGLVLLTACAPAPPVGTTALRAVVGEQPVVLLSTSWCGYCRKLRGDLNAWRVPFTEYDVEDSDEGIKAFALLRGRSVPILLVNEERLHGYVPDRVRETLRAAGFPDALDAP